MKKLALVLAAMAVQPAFASEAAGFPARPVKLVVPLPAGGATDAAVRIVAEKLSLKWKQSVIVENRPGAAGAIGTDLVVRSAPDGYTALVHVSILLVNEVTKPPANYRLFRDLLPVTTLFLSPVFYVAGPSVKGTTLKEVLNEAKNAKEPMSYGNHGELTSTHLMGVRLNKLAGTDMTMIPYTGDAPIQNALLGGHLSTGFTTGSSARLMMETGKVKLLAQSFYMRSPLFPNVPTFAELGYEDMDRGTWGRVFLPAKTPDAIAVKYAADIKEIVNSKEVRDKFDALSLVARPGTPAQTLTDLQGEYVYWQRRYREMGK